MAPARCGTLRRAATSIARLLLAVAVIGPLEAAAAALLLSRPGMLTRLLAGVGPVTGWMYGQDAAEISAAAIFGLILAGLLFVTTVPRLLAAALQPGKVYPLYGIHYALQRAVSRLTNITFFNYLFGDSSAVVHYLRALGYRLAPVEQTGSNFGMEVKHEVPTLAAVGTGTMVSDGLSFINAEFSSHLVPRHARRHRQAELPRQQHRLPGRRPHRRQLPARHQGHGPDRRPGPRRGRAARLAALRNPAHGPPRPPLRPPRHRPRTAPPAGAPRTGTTPPPSACTCWCGGSTSSAWCLSRC